MRRRWLKRFVQTTASVVAVAALAPMAQAQVKASAPEVKKVEPVKPVNKHILSQATQKKLFARYPDLNSAKTREVLANLQRDPQKAKALKEVSQALTQKKLKARTIESQVLALIKGETADEADIILTAILRTHYDQHLSTTDRPRNVRALAAQLHARDGKLVEAAYGKTPRARRIRKLRRRRT